jgi:hypothetical protein
MDKQNLLKRIADTAYNVGFGAKKHFATFDIVDKAPGWIGFISLTVGVFALYLDTLATKHISAMLVVLGIAGLLINTYGESKQQYESKGVLLTNLFNRLKTLYFSVKSSNNSDFSAEIIELERIELEFNSNGISKQILFSDWYSHYKFFWQHQIEWIDEQKHFRFWRDKIPLSLSVVVVCIFLLAGAIVVYHLYSICVEKISSA